MAHKLKLQKIPEVATQAMMDEHEAQGNPAYRSWCAHCGAGFGLSRRHGAVDHLEDSFPTICSDFDFMQDEPKGGEGKPGPPPFLAAVDRWTKCGIAIALPNKDSPKTYMVRHFGNLFTWLGYRRFTNKSDSQGSRQCRKNHQLEIIKQTEKWKVLSEI